MVYDEPMITEADIDENEELRSELAEADEDYDPPCCPPGSENKWNPATWCSCQH